MVAFGFLPGKESVSALYPVDSWWIERANQFREPWRRKHCKPQRGRSAQRATGPELVRAFAVGDPISIRSLNSTAAIALEVKAVRPF